MWNQLQRDLGICVLDYCILLDVVKMISINKHWNKSIGRSTLLWSRRNMRFNVSQQVPSHVSCRQWLCNYRQNSWKSDWHAEPIVAAMIKRFTDSPHPANLQITLRARQNCCLILFQLLQFCPTLTALNLQNETRRQICRQHICCDDAIPPLFQTNLVSLRFGESCGYNLFASLINVSPNLTELDIMFARSFPRCPDVVIEALTHLTQLKIFRGSLFSSQELTSQQSAALIGAWQNTLESVTIIPRFGDCRDVGEMMPLDVLSALITNGKLTRLHNMLTKSTMQWLSASSSSGNHLTQLYLDLETLTHIPLTICRVAFHFIPHITHFSCTFDSKKLFLLELMIECWSETLQWFSWHCQRFDLLSKETSVLSKFKCLEYFKLIQNEPLFTQLHQEEISYRKIRFHASIVADVLCTVIEKCTSLKVFELQMLHHQSDGDVVTSTRPDYMTLIHRKLSRHYPHLNVRITQ